MKKFLEYAKYVFQAILYFTGIVFVIAFFKKDIPVKPIPPGKVKFNPKPDKENLSESEKAKLALAEINEKKKTMKRVI